MKRTLALAAIAWAALAGGAPAAEKIRIGFISTMSGPIAVLGREQEMGLTLALKALGNKIGGLPVELVKEDARMTPDTALQAATKMVEKDKIDVLVGNMLSNALLAYVKPVTASGAFVLSSIAGPSDLAGAQCNPNLFVVSWQNDQPSEGVGAHMAKMGVKKVSTISQDYVTGREHVAGAQRYFKVTPATQAYVPIQHVDYAAEIASMRAAKPDAVFVFLPGSGGIAFVKQFAASGMMRETKLYSGSWLADEHSFAALGDVAMGIELSAPWFAQLDNPANKRFVEAFKKEHGRNPVFYAAFVWDSLMLLDAAVKAVGGKIEDKDALRAALRKAQFESTRGKFRFNTNHFPIQDYHVAKVVKKDGVLQHEVTGLAFADHKDPYAEKCPMKW